MASSFKKIHVRSISLPSRSHPSTVKVYEEINKIRVLEASSASTSDSIFKGFSGLEDLYICVDEFLSLTSTQHVLSLNCQEKCVEELLDGSVRILDVCEVTRDILAQLKEQVKGLQSALRRRKRDSSMRTSIASFISFRKKMKKDVKKLSTTLKQMDNKWQVLDLDSTHLLAVIGAMREVSFTNVSIFMTLLNFLSVSVSKPNSSNWSFVSKLMHKETTEVNELEDVDVALLSQCKSGANNEKIQAAQEKLEALDMTIEGLENGLEGVFRSLIKARACLLNIVSM